MPKKRSHPMPPLHEISQDYGGIEAGLSRLETAAHLAIRSATREAHR